MTTTLQQLVLDLAHGRVEVVDLTMPLGNDTPVVGLPPIFAPSPGVTVRQLSRYDEKGPGWYWNAITMGEHTGTHFDAPIHWISGKHLHHHATDTIPPGKFVGPACVIDVSNACAQDADFLLRLEHVHAWESEFGRIPDGAWVLLRTDWSKRRGSAYENIDEHGPHTPGFHQDVSTFLVAERNILGVGVETIGTDAGQSFMCTPPFPTQTIMHGHGKFGLAALCNLDQLPPTGSVLVAAPLKLVDGSGSPLRVLALVAR